MATVLNVDTPDRRLLGIESAATYLDTTPRTIQRLIARGVLTKVSIPTLKRVLIAREELDQLIEMGKETSKESCIGNVLLTIEGLANGKE